MTRFLSSGTSSSGGEEKGGPALGVERRKRGPALEAERKMKCRTSLRSGEENQDLLWEVERKVWD